MSALHKLGFLFFAALIFSASPAWAAPESPNELLDKVRAIDDRVKRIEDTQKQILEKQKEIQESIDNLRVWIRSS